MELRQLEYLIAVIDHGTFTRAAHRLHIAQSAVSHHVGALERELGVTLLYRARPTVVPTPAGELFAARARQILAEVSTARDEAVSMRGDTVGEVSFGATVPSANLDVPGIIADFRSAYPGVKVRLREGTGPELLDMVRDDTIDLALISTEPDRLPAGIGWVVVGTDDLRLAGAPGHSFEAYESVPARELDGVDLISFREGAGLRAAADQVLRDAGATPNIIVESNEMPVLVGLVRHGLGLAILPVAFIEQSKQPIWSRPLDPPIRPSLMLIWRRRRRRAPAAAAFLHHLAALAPQPRLDDLD
ncbi:LysR family transcriptional regulator [Nonomuraea rhizosphaerae]|uniref:LysR family transcriptional regulator n=1 Tax=Nonomuraea rhizosphaerae TaxID=2665663 RepID=UPI001C5D106B|nr:LysR family transcriptional regulator [Nonomuraea rhizosphaerae]